MIQTIGHTSEFADLTRLVSPQSIALIGATDKANSMGHRTFTNIMSSTFTGSFYPVSSRLAELEGVRCYSSVEELPESPDVAVIAIPAQHVISAVRECGEAGIRFAIIFSSGFSELGDDGIAAQLELKRTADETGIRLYGPNCPGLWNIREGTAMSFAPSVADDMLAGSIGIVTQGGGLGRSLVQSSGRGIGAALWASVGNAVDLDVADFVAHCAGDEDISVIAALLEGIDDGDHFRRAALEAAESDTPVVVLKAGRSEEGIRASASHTAALAGSAEINSAVFDELGIIEVDDTDELMDIAWLLSKARPKERTRFAVFGASGGAVTFTADFMGEAGLELAELREETVDAIQSEVPDFVRVSNPVDITAGVITDSGMLERTLRALVADPGVDAVVLPIPLTYGSSLSYQADVFAKIQSEVDIPLIPIWMSDLRGPEWEKMRAHGLVSARGLTKAIAMLTRWVDYGANRSERARRLQEAQHWAAGDAPGELAVPTAPLTEFQTKSWLRAHGVVSPTGFIAQSADDAAQGVDEGRIFVAKVSSADIQHKSDVGGVRLGIASRTDARDAYDGILASAASAVPDAHVDGVLFEEMADPEGVDLIVGVHTDEVFGKILTVGAGGVYVEILDDVQRSLVPVTRQRVHEMLTRLRIWPLLSGARGRAPVDLESLVDLIVAVAQIARSAGDALAELELNPVRVSHRGAVALDALLVHRSAEEADG